MHFRRDEPYKFTSGLASPVYIDCRKLISYPRIRGALMDFACAKLMRDAGFEAFDAVAGGETAGIPFAAWIAERLALPMLYVRKKPKGFGRDAQIEGAMAGGRAGAARRGPRHRRRLEARVRRGACARPAARSRHAVVVFYYGIFPDSAGRARRARAAAAPSRDLARRAGRGARAGAVRRARRSREVEAFLGAPLAWSAAHGGVDRLSA